MRRISEQKNRWIAMGLAALIGMSMMPVVPVSAGDVGLRFPWPGQTEEETKAEIETQPETGVQSVTQPETGVQSVTQPETGVQSVTQPETETQFLSDREKSNLIAGGASVAEYEGQTWLFDQNGVYALKDGVETVRYSGQYRGICSAFGSILLIRDDTKNSEAEARMYSLVKLNPEDGAITRLYRFSQTANEPYFMGAGNGMVMISHRGSILALDEKGTVHATPYQSALYFTDHGVYLPETVENGTYAGLLYIPYEKPFGGTVFADLSESSVNACFSFQDRLYLIVDHSIAWIKLDSDDTTLHTLPLQIPIQGEEILLIKCNYEQSPQQTLILTVGMAPQNQENGMYRVHIFSCDMQTKQMQELDVMDSILPLGWPSVTEDSLFVFTLVETRKVGE